MPKTLRFRDVGGFERERIDAVLGRNLAGDVFGGVGISVRVVVQRVVQVEQDDLERTDYCDGCPSSKPATFPCWSCAKKKSIFCLFWNVSA